MNAALSTANQPAMGALPVGSELIASRPTEGLTVYFDIALMAGLVLAAPVIMYQVWLFVMPALYANEKKFVIPFIVLAALGTVAGAAFSHYLLFPSMSTCSKCLLKDRRLPSAPI
jgi:sec-independent protein translocase protein TatC